MTRCAPRPNTQLHGLFYACVGIDSERDFELLSLVDGASPGNSPVPEGYINTIDPRVGSFEGFDDWSVSVRAVISCLQLCPRIVGVFSFMYTHSSHVSLLCVHRPSTHDFLPLQKQAWSTGKPESISVERGSDASKGSSRCVSS